MRELHIASCVVRTLPLKVDDVVQAITTRTACEVFTADQRGKVVVLVEGNSTGELLDQIDVIRAFAGVVSIELVYQHSESVAAMKEAMPCL